MAIQENLVTCFPMTLMIQQPYIVDFRYLREFSCHIRTCKASGSFIVVYSCKMTIQQNFLLVWGSLRLAPTSSIGYYLYLFMQQNSSWVVTSIHPQIKTFSTNSTRFNPYFGRHNYRQYKVGINFVVLLKNVIHFVYPWMEFCL